MKYKKKKNLNSWTRLLDQYLCVASAPLQTDKMTGGGKNGVK